MQHLSHNVFYHFWQKGLSVLRAGNKDNLIHYAARCFGEQRHGNDGPRMPLDRMPFGLIAHNLKFFALDNVSNLRAPDDYRSWCQSMYTLFGNKWTSMHLGPMWSYELESENVSPANDSSSSLDIISQALQETFGVDTTNFGTSRLCVTVSLINVLYYFVQPIPRLSKIGRTKRLA